MIATLRWLSSLYALYALSTWVRNDGMSPAETIETRMVIAHVARHYICLPVRLVIFSASTDGTGGDGSDSGARLSTDLKQYFRKRALARTTVMSFSRGGLALSARWTHCDVVTSRPAYFILAAKMT